MNILSLQNVHKAYGKFSQHKEVLKGVDLELKQGSVMGLIGANGSGKTTLLKTALGLLKADQGQAQVFSENSWNMSADCKQKLGYVAQKLDCFQWMTPKQLFDYTGAFYQNWDKNKVADLIKKMDVDLKQKISNMSEGQCQHVSIIQALGHSPELIVLDEPVASLDPAARRSFVKELIDMNLDNQTSILFSTHITSDLERVAAEVAFLKSGKICYQGNIDDLKENVVRLLIKSTQSLPEIATSLELTNSLALTDSLERTKNPEVIHHDFKGQHGRMTVKNFDAHQMVMWQKEFNAEITVEALSLEDIFLELNA
ncbi:ABC transporter ATP-binding protein [Paraglaciecola aquimarina]|uniref:ABC transporter ATP-binding protein n=1 Tax=Paraglaciecola algarum TaxID=3050085 RepID=A0ABS9D7R7_9ALTE|nr:ABC transporter ATP-binding protein [Paraglaciecola sp. G1-23]MCF2947711.1 ABC transporter ATP-binding protein [Paraglaciecola sp. G1-23]